MTPTARTLQRARELGFTAQVVERWRQLPQATGEYLRQQQKG